MHNYWLKQDGIKEELGLAFVVVYFQHVYVVQVLVLLVVTFVCRAKLFV
jgi:hypothetical protein